MSENEQKHTFKPVSGKSGGTGGKDEKALPGASFEANRANIEAWAEENERNGGKYLLSRGISLEVQKRFKVGLSRAWAHPKTLNEGGKAFYSERCIIPYSWEAYLARATNTTEAKFKALKVKATEGAEMFFNFRTMEQKHGKPVFITEGEIDALSFEEVGGRALSLGSVSNVEAFLQRAGRALKDLPPVVVCLDNDEAGEKAGRRLFQGLKKRGFLCVKASPFPGTLEAVEAWKTQKKQAGTWKSEDEDKRAEEFYFEEGFKAFSKASPNYTKDPNEFLQKNPELFTAWATFQEEELTFQRERERENYASEFLQVFRDFVSFKDKNLNSAPISTGFNSLDKILGGGLENRLYVLGASPSLGKSTLCLQIASHIARAGEDVLFFALEMASSELISKALSSLTAQGAIEKKISLGYSRTASEISRREKWEGFPKISKDLLNKGLSTYGQEIAPRLFIFEGLGEVGLPEIRGAIERHKRATGRAPVVFVDYLQIMKVEEGLRGMSDKQIVDRNILALKKISKEEGLPVFCVSSFGRSNYSEEAGQSSFKESGAIEYGADVLLGLQLEVISSEEYTKKGQTESEKRRLIKEALRRNTNGVNERRLSLQVLKNRAGELGEVPFRFFPAYNLFWELPTEQKEQEATPTEGGFQEEESPEELPW